jgi:hypothetical protein
MDPSIFNIQVEEDGDDGDDGDDGTDDLNCMTST